MSQPSFPYGEDVAIARREVIGQDQYGNDVREIVTTTIPGCVIWPRMSQEFLDARDTVITGITVMFPPATDVEAIDAVIVRGEEYEVTGTPFVWAQNPWTNSKAGVQVELRQVTG